MGARVLDCRSMTAIGLSANPDEPVAAVGLNDADEGPGEEDVLAAPFDLAIGADPADRVIGIEQHVNCPTPNMVLMKLKNGLRSRF